MSSKLSFEENGLPIIKNLTFTENSQLLSIIEDILDRDSITSLEELNKILFRESTLIAKGGLSYEELKRYISGVVSFYLSNDG